MIPWATAWPNRISRVKRATTPKKTRFRLLLVLRAFGSSTSTGRAAGVRALSACACVSPEARRRSSTPCAATASCDDANGGPRVPDALDQDSVSVEQRDCDRAIANRIGGGRSAGEPVQSARDGPPPAPAAESRVRARPTARQRRRCCRWGSDRSAARRRSRPRRSGSATAPARPARRASAKRSTSSRRATSHTARRALMATPPRGTAPPASAAARRNASPIRPREPHRGSAEDRPPGRA